ncbi:MAG: hypothetical protein FWE88_01290 [Phycisphaerae bacterium]|nr:hypothetical protein [Phycisphaerae bacterium]
MTERSQRDSSTFSRELTELKRRLQEQQALLRDERLEELVELMRETTQRLQTVAGATSGGLAEEFAADLAEIRSLHSALELSLADRLADTRDRLGRLNKGRQALRAYRG